MKNKRQKQTIKANDKIKQQIIKENVFLVYLSKRGESKTSDIADDFGTNWVQQFCKEMNEIKNGIKMILI